MSIWFEISREDWVPFLNKYKEFVIPIFKHKDLFGGCSRAYTTYLHYEVIKASLRFCDT
jgi:hypothetical protein